MTKKQLMTAEREIELVREVNREAGDFNRYRRALDELVLANVGLVHKIVHKFPIKNANCSYDDLYQEGIAGLIHGIQKFDVTRGYRLSTYVYRWIQAYVSRYFQNQGKTIRVPVHLSTAQQSMNKQVEALTKELERMPTTTECAEHIDDYENMLVATRDVTSLNQCLSEDGELMELAGVDNTEETDTTLDTELMLDTLRKQVSERDYNILVKRYGMFGEPEHTLSELAEEYGITRARVHQVEKHCVALLRSAV